MVKKSRLASGLFFILILFLACAEESSQSTKSPQILSDPQELKIITHDSFDIGKEIIKKISLEDPAPNPVIVFGKSNIDDANITGITPAVLIFSGRCELWPP